MLESTGGKPIREHRGKRVRGISQECLDRMIAQLKGLVIGFCTNNPYRQFSIRDLLGGENFVWVGTPLQDLYEKHINEGKSDDEAITAAGQDAGRLLKRAIIEMEGRTFVLSDAGLVNGYTWKGDHL